MTRKAPAGVKHARCLDHIPHSYPSNGWLCITTRDETRAADMAAFADHLAAVAARHTAAERSAPIYGRMVKRETEAIATWRLNLGRMAPGASGHRKATDKLTYGPFLAECHWTASPLTCQVPIVVAPAIVAPVVVAPVVRKARKVAKVATVIVTPEVEIPAPVAPEPYTAEHDAPIAYRVSWGSIGEPEYGSQVVATRDEAERMREDLAYSVVTVRRVEPAPEVVRDALAYCNGCDRPSADLDPLSGYCPDCMAQVAPEPAPVAAPVIVAPAPVVAAVAVVTRPTCPRCAQVFRVKGTGLAWHLANRPDCAGPIVAPIPSAVTYSASIGA